MTEIVIEGSIKAWKDGESTNEFVELNVGETLYTKAADASSTFSSPSFEFFNSKSLLIEYSADTWTVEYTRSLLPVWVFSSFFSNVLYFDFYTVLQLSYVITHCFLVSVYNFLGSVLNLSQDCCSSKNIIDFFK